MHNKPTFISQDRKDSIPEEAEAHQINTELTLPEVSEETPKPTTTESVESKNGPSVDDLAAT